MKLIIGLGNPGKEYQKTRHNVGFLAVDKIADFFNEIILVKWKSQFRGQVAKCRYKEEDFLLLKPETYMNLSGESVKEVIDFYKIDIKDIIVIYDDVDLTLGKIRIRGDGNSGGHNGMKSIFQHLGTTEINRVRIGIGKNPVMITSDYVLGKFSAEEWELINPSLNIVVKAIVDFLSLPLDKIMNKYSG